MLYDKDRLVRELTHQIPVVDIPLAVTAHALRIP